MSTTQAGGPVTCSAEGAAAEACVLPFTSVPLGGPRAMTVRRSLPQRRRSLIGAWCFADHYGPDDVAASGGMAVPGHPHTGLSTASWLFTGEVEHRDTTGAHAYVRPGELNLMTAGEGIAHSEFSTPTTQVIPSVNGPQSARESASRSQAREQARSLHSPQSAVLHGVQLWLALPGAARFVEPSFTHHVAEQVKVDGATALVFLGDLFGVSSPVVTHTALVGAELRLPARRRVAIDVNPAHEHGFLAASGVLQVGDLVAEPGEIAYVPRGKRQIVVTAPVDTRVVIIGGEPLGEQIVMWWNFIGRTHEEIAEFRSDWQREREELSGGRYGAFPAEWASTLPAPEMPRTTLKPRG